MRQLEKKNCKRLWKNLVLSSPKYLGRRLPGEEQNEKSRIFDAIVTQPPSAWSRSCISTVFKCHVDELEIDKEETALFAVSRKRVSKPGVYTVVLPEFYTIDEWITAFSNCGFLVMSYPYAFVYDADSIPRKSKQVSQKHHPISCACKAS